MAIKVTNLPNGKVLVDGVEMSRATYQSRYKMTPAGKKTIASNPDKKVQLKQPTKQELKTDKKAAKQNTKILKKVDKANYSSGADAARKKAAERAKTVAPEKRTAAQTRAIKTEARYKAGLPGYSKGPLTKELKKEQKTIEKKATAKAKVKTSTPKVRGGGGLRGPIGTFGGGGSGGPFGKMD
jgi:hypothetical protein